MKYITCLVIGLFMTNTSYAYTDIKKYPKESCQEIYQAIGTFLGLADGEWKERNGEKAMFYSTASANYSTVFQTVCIKPQNSLDGDLLDIYYKMPTFLLDD